MVLLLATSVALIAADRQDPAIFDGARTSAFAVSEPVRVGLSAVSSQAAGAWNGARGYEHWEDETRRLQERVDELEGQRRRLPDLELELRRLLEATDIQFVDDLETVTARVIVDRVSPSGHVIEVDKGTRHGLRVGMPVVTGRGLVGVVEVVTGSRAVITPITASQADLGVRAFVEYGLATGQGPTDDLLLVLDPRVSEAPSIGERFVTSGLDRSLYPDNLPVGTLAETPDGTLVLEPLVDFGQLGYLTILLWRAGP